MSQLTQQSLSSLERVNPQPSVEFNHKLCAYLCLLHHSKKAAPDGETRQLQRDILTQLSELYKATNSQALVLLSLPENETSWEFSLTLYLGAYFSATPPITMEKFADVLAQDANSLFKTSSKLDFQQKIAEVANRIRTIYNQLEEGVTARMEGRAQDLKQGPSGPGPSPTVTAPQLSPAQRQASSPQQPTSALPPTVVLSARPSASSTSSSNSSSSSSPAHATINLPHQASTTPAATIAVSLAPAAADRNTAGAKEKKEQNPVFAFKPDKPAVPFEPMFCAMLCMQQFGLDILKDKYPVGSFEGFIKSNFFLARNNLLINKHFSSAVLKFYKFAHPSGKNKSIHIDAYLANYFLDADQHRLQEVIKAQIARHIESLIDSLSPIGIVDAEKNQKNFQRFCAKLAIHLAPFFPKEGTAPLNQAVTELAQEEYSVPSSAASTTLSAAAAPTTKPAQPGPAISSASSSSSSASLSTASPAAAAAPAVSAPPTKPAPGPATSSASSSSSSSSSSSAHATINLPQTAASASAAPAPPSSTQETAQGRLDAYALQPRPNNFNPSYFASLLMGSIGVNKLKTLEKEVFQSVEPILFEAVRISSNIQYSNASHLHSHSREYFQLTFPDRQMGDMEQRVNKYLQPLIQSFLQTQDLDGTLNEENFRRAHAKLALELAKDFEVTMTDNLTEFQQLAQENYELPEPPAHSVSSSSSSASSSAASPAAPAATIAVSPAFAGDRTTSDAKDSKGQNPIFNFKPNKPDRPFNLLYCGLLFVSPEMMADGSKTSKNFHLRCKNFTNSRIELLKKYLDTATPSTAPPDEYLKQYFSDDNVTTVKDLILKQARVHIAELAKIYPNIEPAQEASATKVTREHFDRFSAKLAKALTPFFPKEGTAALKKVKEGQATHPYPAPLPDKSMTASSAAPATAGAVSASKPATGPATSSASSSSSSASSAASPEVSATTTAPPTATASPTTTGMAAAAPAKPAPSPASSSASSSSSSASSAASPAAPATIPAIPAPSTKPAEPSFSALSSSSSARSSSSSSSSPSSAPSSSRASTSASSTTPSDVYASPTSCGLFSQTGCLRPKRLIVGTLVGGEVLCAVLCVRSLPQNPRAHLDKVFSTPAAIGGMAIAAILICMAIKAAVDHSKAASKKSANYNHK